MRDIVKNDQPMIITKNENEHHIMLERHCGAHDPNNFNNTLL
jgi:hypothetical protein